MEQTQTPTKLEIVRAATNAPELSTRTVPLGDREFKVVDLEYDDYLLFMAQLQPLLEGLLGNLPGVRGLGLSSVLSPTDIMRYCGKSLVDMAVIVCKQTDPSVTAEEVKRLAKSPFKLVTVVMAQIEQNNIIGELKDFFNLVLPLLKGIRKN